MAAINIKIFFLMVIISAYQLYSIDIRDTKRLYKDLQCKLRNNPDLQVTILRKYPQFQATIDALNNRNFERITIREFWNALNPSLQTMHNICRVAKDTKAIQAAKGEYQEVKKIFNKTPGLEAWIRRKHPEIPEIALNALKHRNIEKIATLELWENLRLPLKQLCDICFQLYTLSSSVVNESHDYCSLKKTTITIFTGRFNAQGHRMYHQFTRCECNYD